MLNLAERKEALQPFLDCGRVLKKGDHSFSVTTSYGVLEAQKALSCLMEPRAGDTVLVACNASDAHFILAVLRSEDPEAGADMVFDGPVRVSIRSGGLAVAADRDVAIASHQAISLTSTTIGVHADTGEARIGEMSFVSKLLKTHIEYIKSVAVTVDEIYQKLTQRLENCFRFIEDQEEVQSGSSRYLAEDLLTMHSKNSLIVAEEHVTINAEKIHLG